LLDGISKVRAVWISQYYQYVAHRMQSAHLEKPLDSFSASELEWWEGVVMSVGDARI